MGFFSKNRKIDGWMAIQLQPEGVCATHVKRAPSGMPSVELTAFFPADKASLPGVLQKAAKELRMDHYRCSTLLAPDEFQLLSLDAPSVPPEELKAAIRWRLKDMLDFHVDDATIDVLDIPLEKNSATRNHAMYAVAARNQVIQQRQAMFEEAKIPLSVIDIPEMAQRNLSALVEPEGRGVAMLTFGHDGGLLTVTFSGELYLSRRIEVSMAQLGHEDAGQRQACYDRITLELQRSLDHFDRQYHFITISKLLIGPLTGTALEVKDYLTTNLYLPVESLALASVLDLTRVPELAQSESQQRYFMVLGAALRHEEKVL